MRLRGAPLNRLLAAVGGLGLTVAAGSGRTAHACEAGYCVREVTPADQAIVPEDSQFRIYHDNTPGATPLVRLIRIPTGIEVDASIVLERGAFRFSEVRHATTVVIPSSPLSVGDYALEFFGQDQISSVSDVEPIQVSVEPESAAAVSGFSGLAEVTSECMGLLEPDAIHSCNDNDVRPVRRYTLDGAAVANTAGYRGYLDGEFVVSGPTLPLTVDVLPDPATGSGCFSLRAVNAAGVEDSNGVMICIDQVAQACGPDPRPDAGPAVGPDAGPDDMDTTSHGGCATSSGHGNGAPSLVLLAVVWGLARRWERVPIAARRR